MVVEVEIKGHFVVEAKIFAKDFSFLHKAQSEGYQSAALAPEEKASPIRHSLSKPAEKFRGQLLEVKLGAPENLKVKRIDFLDHGRDVAHNRHIDWRGIIGCLQFASQVTPSFCAKPLGDIIVKVCKVDFERGHWHTWDTLESFRFEAAEQRTIVRGEFFEHDQMCPELARQLGNVGCENRHCRSTTSLVHVALSSCAADHDRAEVQETRPNAPDRGGNPVCAAHTSQHVLIEEEEGLNCKHLAICVFDDEVTIVKTLIERFIQERIVAMIFALRGERTPPMRIALNFRTVDNLDIDRAGGIAES